MIVDEEPSGDDSVEMVGTSDRLESQSGAQISVMEPHEGMQFESEEAAKKYYDAYATQLGFIIRVGTRRSLRGGEVFWRRFLCNKEGFRRVKPGQGEIKIPRATTREGCKAMIGVKKLKSGKWVVTQFVKEHSHPLVVAPANSCQRVSQTVDDKDVKIRELTLELLRERKRCAVLQEQLNMVLKEVEEHSNHLSRNVDDIIQQVRNIEGDHTALPFS